MDIDDSSVFGYEEFLTYLILLYFLCLLNQVFMEADIDDSGVLEYEEFLPLMVQGII